MISRDAPEFGTFHGVAIYFLSEVLQSKARENWMRSGRAQRDGEQPLKRFKQGAATLNPRRELEASPGAQGANENDEAKQVCTRRSKQRNMFYHPWSPYAFSSPNGVIFQLFLRACRRVVCECRVESQRTTSGTLIYTLRPRFSPELHAIPCAPLIGHHAYFHLRRISCNLQIRALQKSHVSYLKI